MLWVVKKNNKLQHIINMEGSTTLSKLEFELPGFRFHPNEEELLNFYLRSIVHGKKIRGDIIGFLNIYNHDPRELPGLAKIGEREWYFFVCRDRKHGSGGRPSRTTKTGFWKATGSDKKIMSASDPKKMLLGHRKTLVFYEGRAPRGAKTDWVMNEYRLPDHECSGPNSKDIVLCKIYKKATPLKVLEQRAALMEEEEDEEEEDPIDKIQVPTSSNLEQAMQSRCNIILGRDNLAQLEVPKFNMDWKQDYIWMLENLSPFLPMF